jgi:hypothetical protein
MKLSKMMMIMLLKPASCEGDGPSPPEDSSPTWWIGFGLARRPWADDIFFFFVSKNFVSPMGVKKPNCVLMLSICMSGSYFLICVTYEFYKL